MLLKTMIVAATYKAAIDYANRAGLPAFRHADKCSDVFGTIRDTPVVDQTGHVGRRTLAVPGLPRRLSFLRSSVDSRTVPDAALDLGSRNHKKAIERRTARFADYQRTFPKGLAMNRPPMHRDRDNREGE